jgi:ubiquinone/menaquinone biosynthesis C-methylase UbiE
VGFQTLECLNRAISYELGNAIQYLTNDKSLNSIKVLHIAITPLAGAPIRIVNALKRHTDVGARLVVLNPGAYNQRTFDDDLVWEADKCQVLDLLREADLVHFHHYFELESNPFGVDFRETCLRAKFVRQFHTHPLTIASGDITLARQIVGSFIPQLVIGQHHERFYPWARVVPNIVPLDHELYQPVERGGTEPAIFFAPTVDYPATSVAPVNTRWETKGAAETEALLLHAIKVCGKGRVYVRRNIPHNQCLREKQGSDIAIDEMVTGSFHLSSLEALAQGVPTFAYLDSRSLETLAELTGAHTHPWLNFRLEEAEQPLIELINDSELRREMGAFARYWMEKYYNDREMVSHYVHAYEDLLERPEAFKKPRFDTGSRRQVFLAQRRDDFIWEKRKTRIGAENSHSAVKSTDSQVVVDNMMRPMPNWLKRPVHDIVKKYTSVRVDEIQALRKRLVATERLLEFVSADETNRWLYQNRLERMDATLDIFDENRREFHLDRYRFAAQRVKGKRVLDCASGTGYGTRMLREAGGAASVVGVDIERRAIKYANNNHRLDSTSFICSSGDCLALPSASVDVVISFETIEHVPDDVALVEEFYRVLRPNGLLIISTPNQWPLATTPHHVKEYDRSSFLKVMEPQFDCIELYNQNSGSNTPLNHGQTRGIVATTADNEQLAECYIAICRRRTS